jgi:hypothetical protein
MVGRRPFAYSPARSSLWPGNVSDKLAWSASPRTRLPPFRARFGQVINSNHRKEKPVIWLFCGLHLPQHLSDILEELPFLLEKLGNLRFSHLAQINNYCR